jgi:T5orf172 domain
MSRGYVYVIDPHLGVEGRPVVKIGYTTQSPHRRLRELQTALPQRASLAAAVEFPNVEWAERTATQDPRY